MTFIEFARSHGVEIDPSKLHSGPRIQRCGTTEHPRSTNGAYSFDGERGWVYAWDGEGQAKWWNDPNARPYSEAEKRAVRAEHERRLQAADARAAQAARHAHALIDQAKVDEHPYLMFKGLPKVTGFVLEDGALLVPMRDVATNELRGGQVIRWLAEERRYEKKMLPGMRAKGAVLRLGPPRATELILCEGYATGLSIELAAKQLRLGAAVVVSFSDSNMVTVAERTKGRRIVFADNDASGAGLRAAEATGLPFCMSDRQGEDANDVFVRAGVLTVASMLMKARAGDG